MVITEIQATSKLLEYKEAGWKIATGPIAGARMVFIDIVTDESVIGHGCTGTGALFLSGESEISVIHAVREVFSPLLAGKNPFDVEGIVRAMDRAVLWNFRAKAGIDFALHDLIGRALGVPVRNLLGGFASNPIPIMRLVGLKEANHMAADAISLVGQGYRALKIKVGEDRKSDTARIEAIREAVPDDITLTVDINQAYSPKNAVALINELENYNVALIEQPVYREDIRGLAYVREHVNIPVEADESVITPAEAVRVLESDAADFISIKPIKMGGLHKAKKIAALCQAFNVGCIVGTTGASQLIDVANAHFIASTSNVWWAAEIGEFAKIKGDPVSGAVIRDGCLEVPQGPGFGVTIAL